MTKKGCAPRVGWEIGNTVTSIHWDCGLVGYFTPSLVSCEILESRALTLGLPEHRERTLMIMLIMMMVMRWMLRMMLLILILMTIKFINAHCLQISYFINQIRHNSCQTTRYLTIFLTGTQQREPEQDKSQSASVSQPTSATRISELIKLFQIAMPREWGSRPPKADVFNAP